MGQGRRMNQLAGLLQSRGVHRLRCGWHSVPAVGRQTQRYAGFRTGEGFGSLIPARSLRPAPRASGSSPFSFSSAKTNPTTLSRSALRPSVRPQPCCPSGAVHPSAPDPSLPAPAGDGDGIQSASGYKEKGKKKSYKIKPNSW